MTTASAQLDAPHDARLFIGGDWRTASDGGTRPITDPATLADLGAMAIATVMDVDDALDAARAGFEVWRTTSAWDRSEVLRRVAVTLRERAPAIATTLTMEQGKPHREALGEVQAAADQFDWYADEARRIYGRIIDGHRRSQRLSVHRQPIGPVAAFVPWNFPILLGARKIAPALAAGCSIVVKGPSEAPNALLAIADAAVDAGLPPGVLNVLMGDARSIAARLIGSPVIRKVTLTGSVHAAKEILRLCAEVAKPATMELGGNAPTIVLADADLTSAVEASVQAKFRNAGQICIAPNSFFIEASVYDTFVEGFVSKARGLKLGAGIDPAVDIGPLANARRLAETDDLVRDARNDGARLLLGGERDPDAGPGFFYRPTVLADARLLMRVVREEIFGPVAPMVEVDDLAGALRQVNEVNHGLVTYLFTSNAKSVYQAIDELDCGMVGVNNLMIATAEAPFGGAKDAGYGRENGSEGIDGYLTTKYVNWIP